MKVDLSKLQQLDNLIYHKATGTPKQLAEHLEISERTLYNYLQYLREDLEISILWDNWRKTYYYEKEGRLVINFLPPPHFINKIPEILYKVQHCCKEIAVTAIIFELSKRMFYFKF